MSRRASDLQTEFRNEVAVAFSFLSEQAGFAQPVMTKDQRFSSTGLLFRSPGLDVEVQFFDMREPEVFTGLTVVGPDGALREHVGLDKLYVSAGCGPAQDVPGQAPNRRSTLKRVGQQATALRKLMSRFPVPELSQLIIDLKGVKGTAL
ncbi:hypothetical protein [Streptomyces sp. NPDC046821]|uniref:hypothetical protein n=1 Tax=Streptomyces sp. NPDC046821 TaxID=3154702 RepID=UPI00340FFE23